MVGLKPGVHSIPRPTPTQQLWPGHLRRRLGDMDGHIFPLPERWPRSLASMPCLEAHSLESTMGPTTAAKSPTRRVRKFGGGTKCYRPRHQRAGKLESMAHGPLEPLHATPLPPPDPHQRSSLRSPSRFVLPTTLRAKKQVRTLYLEYNYSLCFSQIFFRTTSIIFVADDFRFSPYGLR